MPSQTVRIDNMVPGTTAVEVRAHFKKVGFIKSVRVPTNVSLHKWQQQSHKGCQCSDLRGSMFGFVEYHNEAHAIAAVAKHNGEQLGHLIVSVSLASQKQPKRGSKKQRKPKKVVVETNCPKQCVGAPLSKTPLSKSAKKNAKKRAARRHRQLEEHSNASTTTLSDVFSTEDAPCHFDDDSKIEFGSF